MTTRRQAALAACAVFIALEVAACKTGVQREERMDASLALAPASMVRVGTVDERYQSYNVEMLEVTGGKFWKPYKDIAKMPAKTAGQAGTAAQSGDAPAGMRSPGVDPRQPARFASVLRRASSSRRRAGIAA